MATTIIDKFWCGWGWGFQREGLLQWDRLFRALFCCCFCPVFSEGIRTHTKAGETASAGLFTYFLSSHKNFTPVNFKPMVGSGDLEFYSPALLPLPSLASQNPAQPLGDWGFASLPERDSGALGIMWQALSIPLATILDLWIKDRFQSHVLKPGCFFLKCPFWGNLNSPW